MSVAGMEIVEMAVADIKVSGYNPRVISRHDAQKLRDSLGRFGLVEPLVWNRRTGHLVGGHQRLDAAKDSGIEKVAVSVVDLPEDEERVLNLALNRISGDWDWERVAALLHSLPDDLVKMTGFLEEEMAPLLAATFDKPAVVGDMEIDFQSFKERKIVVITADLFEVWRKAVDRARGIELSLVGKSDEVAVRWILTDWLKRVEP